VTALKVSSVGYRTGDVATNSRVTLASTVVLDGSNGSIPVSQAPSNVGSEWKSDMIVKIRRFLAAPDERTLSLRVMERNLFGWIGVVFVALFVLSYIAWFIRKVTGRA